VELPQGYCEQKPLNLEMTTSIVLSVLLLIYVESFLLNLSYPNFSLFFRNKYQKIYLEESDILGRGRRRAAEGI